MPAPTLGSVALIKDLRYRTYFKPDASGKRLIWMSHCIVVGYAVFIASFSVGLFYAGISMGYLYLMMGVIISSAVLPATLTLTWAGQNKWAVCGNIVCAVCPESN